MSIDSMTGFARAGGQQGGLVWTWEVKSVNGRNLDARCRLPPGAKGKPEHSIERLLQGDE